MVVSVLPVIIDAILPISESGPYVAKILFKSINDDDDDIGLKKAIGIISFGNSLMLINDVISVTILLFTKIVTDTIMANILGNISNDRFNPSLTPFKNSLYISTFFTNP